MPIYVHFSKANMVRLSSYLYESDSETTYVPILEPA